MHGETLLVEQTCIVLWSFFSVELSINYVLWPRWRENGRIWKCFFFFFYFAIESLRKTCNGLSRGELTFLMNSLFGGFNCAVGRRRQEGTKKKEREGRRGARVQSTVYPEMKWIIECGINTANKLWRPPLSKKKRKTAENGARERGGRDGQREKGWDREGERKSQLPSGGKAAIEKLLNLHLAGLIGNEEAY